jgi:Cu+-exporting ATPase
MADAPIRLDLPIAGMTCGACALRLEKVLSRVDGVEQVSVNYATHTASMRLRPVGLGRDRLVQAVEKAGYSVPMVEGEDPASAARALAEVERAEAGAIGRDALLAAILATPVMVLGMFAMHWRPGHWLSLLLTVLLLAGPGWRILRDAAAAARQGSANMNSLVSLGVLAALGLSTAALFVPALGHRAIYFESAAVVVALVLLGRWLEGQARARAGEAVGTLLSLAPRQARISRGGQVVEVPAAGLQPGDLLLVPPGEHIPVDGLVEQGRGSVDESMLTGESLPQDRGPGAQVYAGTINGPAPLWIRATATGRSMAVSRIAEAVLAAQGSRLPIQAQVDRVAAIFTPLVLLLSLLTFGGWMLWGPGLVEALLSAVTVLVIACPCALGLATPVAVLVATGRAAQAGLIFRDGMSLERAAEVRTVLFDKTGTLTDGRFSLVQREGPPELLSVAAALEAQSEHPIGRALVEAARAEGAKLARAEEVVSQPGRGISGRVEGARWQLGNRAALSGLELPEEQLRSMEQQGLTLILGAREGRYVGALGLVDQPRPEARAVVQALLGQGLEVQMITGDAEAPARRVAAALGIEAVHAGLRPEQKLALVTAVRGRGPVAMVGDGINDGPALAAATLGMAMGGASAVAVQAAAVQLLRPELRLVLEALELARQTRRVIRQNLVQAFVYNLLALPLAAGLFYPWLGWRLSPMVASAAMVMSSLSVVLSSLRIWRSVGAQGR